MAIVKNELKGKQRVLNSLVNPGETIDLKADEMKLPKILHALETGTLSEVKEAPKPTNKAK